MPNPMIPEIEGGWGRGVSSLLARHESHQHPTKIFGTKIQSTPRAL